MATEWELIKRVFDAALRLNPKDRQTFLDAACESNLVVRQTVEDLLASHDDASGFMDDEVSVTANEPVFAVGDLVDKRFRVVRFISRGGMGEVYEVYDERLDCKLALKTLRPEYRSDQGALERFRREIRVAREVGHPHLCRVYELVEHHRAPLYAGEVPPEHDIVTCLTMQLLEGETLQSFLARKRTLSCAAALVMIRQIADGIDALHRQGIIHRDLKPSNIMVTRTKTGDLCMAVMDFGLAKPTARGSEAFESRSDFRAGAPYYLAPELIRGERPTPASDIYAFGLIVDEMVTESRPYSGDSIEGILYQKLWGTASAPSVRAHGLPENWSNAIQRCLSRDPANRYATAKAVVAELELNPVKRSAPVQALVSLGAKLRRNLPSVRSLRIRVLAPAIVAPVAVCLAMITLLGSRPFNTSILVFPIDDQTAKFGFVSAGFESELARRLKMISGLDVVEFQSPRPRDFHPSTRFSLTGRLVTAEGHPQLAMQLMENRSGRTVWSGNYLAAETAPLQAQAKIALGIVDALRDAVLLPALAGRERSSQTLLDAMHTMRDELVPARYKPGNGPTPSEPAMAAYLHAEGLYQERTRGTVDEAVQWYRNALRFDDRFALAYAGLANAETTLLQYSVAAHEQLQEQARAHAERAVALAPESPEAYTALAAVHQNDWDWQRADQNFRHAIQLQPNYALAHRWHAGLLIERGYFTEGIQEARTAAALDPFNMPGRVIVGSYLFNAGRFEEATGYLESLRLEGDCPFSHEVLFWIYAQRGTDAGNSADQQKFLDLAEREAELVKAQEATADHPDDSGRSLPLYALLYALRGDSRQSAIHLNRLIDGWKAHKNSSQELADVYVAIGNPKKALEIISQGVRDKDPNLLEFRIDPFLKPLHNYPEFRELVKVAGL